MSAEDILGQQTTTRRIVTPAMQRRNVPPDIVRELLAPGTRAAPTGPGVPLGSQAAPGLPPTIQIGTTAVYTTLPANAGNFNWTDEALDVTQTAVNTDVLVQTRTVPDGRIFYLRDFRLNVIDVTYEISEVGTFSIGIPPQTFTYTVYRNFNTEVFNQDIRVEPLDNYNPIFLVAGPADVITVTVDYDYSAVVFPMGAINITVYFLSHMRGELLTPNVMPVPYTALLRE